jgi:hypothetical protein
MWRVRTHAHTRARAHAHTKDRESQFLRKEEKQVTQRQKTSASELEAEVSGCDQKVLWEKRNASRVRKNSWRNAHILETQSLFFFFQFLNLSVDVSFRTRKSRCISKSQITPDWSIIIDTLKSFCIFIIIYLIYA